MVRVLAFTSEPLTAMALEVLFRPCHDLSLLSVACNPTELLEQAVSTQPDVLLLTAGAVVDWDLFHTLHSKCPDTKIVLWVHEISPEVAYEAVKSGARGILKKTLAPEMVLKCVRKVHAGEVWFEKSLTHSFLTGRTVKLSKREGQLVTLVSQGLKNKEIAALTSLTEGSVKVYLSRLFEKLGVRDRFELALFGLRNLNAGVDVTAATALESPPPAPGQAGAVRRKMNSQSARLFFARAGQ